MATGEFRRPHRSAVYRDCLRPWCGIDVCETCVRRASQPTTSIRQPADYGHHDSRSHGDTGESPLEDTKTDIRTLWNSNNSIPIVGHVHDIHGKPVSGANVSHPVWVNSELKSDRTQTDAEGRFELSVIGKDLVTYSNIWIWHDGYSLATPSLYQFIPSVAEHASREVLLQPESLVRFRIERPDGRTLANADVYPAEMRISNYPESLDGMHGLYSFPPDDELKKFTMRKTDENGEVQLRHVPVEVLSAVGVVTEEFGIQEFYSEYLTGPRRLMLEPVGRLHGTAPPGTRIAIQSRPVSTPPVICEGRANVVADADGNFVVKALAAGKVLIMPHNAEHPEWLMEDQYAELQPASTLTLDIVPQATIPATGRLVLADSKLPIANVRVWLQVGPRRTSPGLMLTDADGKFTARCLPGKRLNAQVTLLPEATMLYPKPTQLIIVVARGSGGQYWCAAPDEG